MKHARTTLTPPGLVTPSPIQSVAIRPIAAGLDVIVQARSGTGKTATYAIGLLSRLDPRDRALQSIVLSPSRELAAQSARVILALGAAMHVGVHACIGGRAVGEDLRKIAHGRLQIASGTPGRMLDLLRRGALDPSAVRALVLDEADEMLGRGFRSQIAEIYRAVPHQTQIVLVSATMPRIVLDMAAKFMVEPVRILVPRTQLARGSVRQFYVQVDAEAWKFDTLCDLYDALVVAQSIVFCGSRQRLDELAAALEKADFAVVATHGEMDQTDRERALHAFRTGEARVLLATDLWARGIDIPQVSLVVNYDAPRTEEAYIHRIGRAGRFGRPGVAVTFIVGERELRALRDVGGGEAVPMPADLGGLL